MADTKSPLETSAPSQKRPLEEPSSPSGPADAPEAKRPALDKVTDPAAAQESEQSFTTQASDAPAASATEPSEVSATADQTNGKASSTTQDEPAADVTASANLDTGAAQSIVPSASSNGTHDGYRVDTQGSAPHHSTDETTWLHLRSIISSAEAATVIGKGGENVSQIRRLAGAKCTVSEYTRGAVERILTVSGPVDAVAKAFGLIIRTLNQEPLDQPSTPQSKTYPLRLLIPHILIGSIIGKGGVRIREIQDASGSRLNASESCLPLSTERSLVVLGVADAIHIAAYYIGSTLVEQLTERFGGPSASAYASRHGGSQGAMPGGMQVAPYVPINAGGQTGHPEYRKQMPLPNRAQPPNPYGGMQYMQAQPPVTPTAYGAGSPRGAYAGAGPQQPYGHMPQQPMHAGAPAQPMPGPAFAGQAITQQIYIPNDMVGAIIGKGGAKINEIRTLSGSVIKINEPQDNSNERLVTVTGTQECNQMALYMLYQRLGESSKNSNSMMPR